MLQATRDDGHDFEFLSKPVHPKVLLEKIRRVSGKL
jgi:hypothetical protein